MTPPHSIPQMIRTTRMFSSLVKYPLLQSEPFPSPSHSRDGGQRIPLLCFQGNAASPLSLLFSEQVISMLQKT